ncbi:MAG: hypothetical protein CMJ27_13960 [Phycisphaerae bacterium]|nr:hypothetical protein [Phycisphaerae bacterium]
MRLRTVKLRRTASIAPRGASVVVGSRNRREAGASTRDVHWCGSSRLGGLLLVLLGWFSVALAMGSVRGGVEPLPADPLIPAVRSPAAIRGSDLLLPLVIPERPIAWPTTIPVRVGAREIVADVVWLNDRPLEVRSWTSPDKILEVTQQPVGPMERRPGVPVLLVPMPEDADGEIAIADTVWTPAWFDPMPAWAEDREVVRTRGIDADPVLDDPLEWFRWCLLADLQAARPPAEDFQNELARRVAASIANEWRVGLRRVGSSSRGAASQLRERLTAVVTDRADPSGRSVAAWPTDQRALAGLRSLLLDPGRTPSEAVGAGLAWLDARPAFLVMEIASDGDRVEVDILNPTRGELVVTATWESDPTGVPLLAAPSTITRHEIDRPDLGGGPLPSDEVLSLAHAGRVTRIPFGPRAIPVRPPGASFGTFILPRTLADVDGDVVQAVNGAEFTQAVLRRREGRWEIFIEARHLPTVDADDRIFLQVGDRRRPAGVVEIRPDGSWERLRGRPDESLKVETRRFGDRWRTSVLLPEAWLVQAISEAGGGSILLGIRRDGPRGFVQYAGISSPAWRRDIIPLAFGINDWNDAAGMNTLPRP